jgi:hypothetical protein
MSTSRLAARLGAIALTVAALVGSASAVAGAGVLSPDKGVLPPKNPSRSVNPSPNFLNSGSCTGGKDSAACNTIVLHAITHAREVLEKIGGMSFSLAAYEKLTVVEQLFVSANLERIERGLPAIVVLTRSLDSVAQDGANADTDPPLRQRARLRLRLDVRRQGIGLGPPRQHPRPVRHHGELRRGTPRDRDGRRPRGQGQGLR